jgi:hypothetical protein
MTNDILDAYISADGTEIIDRKICGGKIVLNSGELYKIGTHCSDFNPDKWYNPEEIGIPLRTKSKKFRLGNSERAEVALTKMINAKPAP